MEEDNDKLKPVIDLTGHCKDEYIVETGDYELVFIEGKWHAIRKKPQYPKTLEECCKVLLLNPEKAICSLFGLEYKRHIVVGLQKLLICRDAYWKTAGGWVPDWLHDDTKYVLVVNSEEIRQEAVKHSNYVLAFPDAEIRDAFYENFKDLIIQCKELL